MPKIAAMPPLRLSPEEFRELADRVAVAATDYLGLLNDRQIFPATSGPQTQEVFDLPLAEEGLGAAALDDLVAVTEHARAGNGRFFGYVLGSGEPIAALADFYISVLNQNVTAWRSAPSAITIERTVVGWLADAIGCHGYSGSLTSGGSAANLMGLAMAREARAPANERGAQQCVVYASDEVHMSIAKAVALLGIGRDNLQSIPVDDDFRMRPDALETAIAEDERARRRPIAIVATAGTINTGAIDPLEEITRIARAHNLWLHIDGAYGALAALALPDRLQGLNQADSISLDAHKWLYQPLDCSLLLYRDAEVARKTFAYSGDYARSLSEDPIEGFSFFEESIELSRRFRALKLWLSLRYHGLRQFRRAISEDLRHAQLLTQLIDANPLLERLAPTELSAVCFRWKGSPEQSLNDRNVAILRHVIRRGRVYLSNTTLRGKFALRACIVNHRTTDDDIAAVVEEVLAAAEETA
jgi:glutamate/tyrosine decarboxylase-like PLP-dependent enzyme